MTNLSNDLVQVPIHSLLEALLHSSYRDIGTVPVSLALVLQAHPQHDVLYHVELELWGGYTIWTLDAWQKFVECDKNWTEYIDKFFADRKAKDLLEETARQSKTVNINKRIKALEIKDPFAGALLKGLFDGI